LAKYRELIEKERSAKLILVGDSVSRRASQVGIIGNVMVSDNVEKTTWSNWLFLSKEPCNQDKEFGSKD
jgi:uncharacterized protein (UPF0218 family)